MRRIVVAGVVLAAGLAIGSAAFAGQTPSPKAYMIAELNVHDAKAYADYAPRVPAVVAKFGGHYIVRGGQTLALEGAAPAQRIVVIEFPSLDAAKAFYGSPDYQALAPIRHAAATGNAYIVEGVAP